MHDVAVAWAAGVLEAKGYARRNGHRMVLRMTDTRPELLERFAEVVGVGRVRPTASKSGELPRWRWEVYSRRDIDAVVGVLGPLLFNDTRDRLAL